MRFFNIGTWIALLCTPFLSMSQNHFQFSSQQTDATNYELSLSIAIPQGDALYADTISFSIDNPDITLSPWKASSEPENKYDAHFKKNKPIFLKPVTFTLNARLADASIPSATLHVSTLSRNGQAYHQQQFPITFQHTKASQKQELDTPPVTNSTKKNAQTAHKNEPSFQQKILELFTETDSWTLRVLLTLLLGLLLSLTPCIYPMIPITVGVLQAQGSKSLTKNFLSASAYVIGIATMFAALGTLAAFSGKMFGSIMHNPFVIISIVTLLVYLSGSMIGLYDLYLPRFLQSNQTQIKSSSLFSIFLFGAASGTVASPCLSPGLVLLLSMVTALGNLWLGFVLLFVFGIGLGIPLLVIGTFSSSMSVLPRAGNWMVDIKQFFGFIMLATCLYFLATILPAYLIAWLSTLFCFGVGIFYFAAANKSKTFSAQLIKNSLGIALVAGSVYLGFEAYKITDMLLYGKEQKTIWMHDYTQAVELAKAEGKKMVIDISAPYCSICKAIDKKIFANTDVQKKLAEFVTVKIDDVEQDEITQSVQKQFSVLGAPTILVYDPETNEEIKRWGGELYELTPEEFIALI